MNTEAGEYISHDGGRTWYRPPAAMGRVSLSSDYGSSLSFGPGGLAVILNGDDDFWVSDDGGRTGRAVKVPILAQIGIVAVAFANRARRLGRRLGPVRLGRGARHFGRGKVVAQGRRNGRAAHLVRFRRTTRCCRWVPGQRDLGQLRPGAHLVRLAPRQRAVYVNRVGVRSRRFRRSPVLPHTERARVHALQCKWWTAVGKVELQRPGRQDGPGGPGSHEPAICMGLWLSRDPVAFHERRPHLVCSPPLPTLGALILGDGGRRPGEATRHKPATSALSESVKAFSGVAPNRIW